MLVGGGAQLFSVIQHLEKRFPGKDLILADNPDESVVVGTSLEYGAASEKSRPSLLFMGDIEALTDSSVDSSADPAAGEPEPEEETKPAFRLESDAGKIYDLIEGENRVGRAAGNEVHIVAEKLSRHHARLLLTGEKLELIDLGSTNGTFLNDIRLEKNQPSALKEGDEIRFGDQSFHVKFSA